MKKIKFKFENIELYTYIIISILMVFILLIFYNFINTNVIKVIGSTEITLDPAKIRISDVNVERFEKIANIIEKKASSKKTSSRVVFE